MAVPPSALTAFCRALCQSAARGGAAKATMSRRALRDRVGRPGGLFLTCAFQRRGISALSCS